MGRVRRVVAGFSVWLALGLLLLTGTATAGAAPTKHCTRGVAATRQGVTLVAGAIRITALAYNATSVHIRSIRPALGCRQARSVLRAFLTAKLDRPLNRCTVPAGQGKGCKVPHRWVCYSTNVRRPLASQVCTHLLLDHGGVVRRITHILFRETDHDRG